MRKLLSHTGGNPFFIDQMLRSLGGGEALAKLTGREIQALGVPQGVKEVILRRLAPLEKPALDLLAVAAVAGQRFRLSVLEAALAKDADVLLETLDGLIAMGLVAEVPGEIDVFSFTHNLLRETQYDQLSTSRRVRLHAAIGRTLEAGEATAPAELAHHFFAARQLVGPGPSIAYSLDAARRASGALAHEEAIEHYERALEAMELAPPDAGRLCRRCSSWATRSSVSTTSTAPGSAMSARLSSPGSWARPICWPGPRSASPTGSASGSSTVKRSSCSRARSPGCRRRQRSCGRRPSPCWPTGLTRSRPRTGARRSVDEALAIARGLDDPTTLDSILRIAPAVLCRPESLERRLALAEEAVGLGHNAESLARAHMHRFLDLFELGRPDEAATALEAYARSFAGLHQQWFEWSLFIVQAMIAILDGRLEDAQRLRAQARELDQATDPEGESWAIQGFLIAHGTDRLGEADEEALRRCAEMYPGWPIWSAMLARTLIGLGREAEARVEFELCARLDFALVPPTQDRLATLALLAECASALGDAPRAATLQRLLGPYAGRTATMDAGLAAWGSISRVLGLLAHTTGDRAQAAAELERGMIEDRERGAALWVLRGALAYRDLLADELEGSSAGRELVGAAFELARTRGLDPGPAPVSR